MTIENPFNHSIQIVEIFASVARDTRLRIFQKENKPVLLPLSESKLVAKLRLLPSMDYTVIIMLAYLVIFFIGQMV